MIRRDVLISQATDIELLAELVSRNGHAEAPTKTVRIRKFREVLVGIGTRETAHIVFHQDVLRELGE